jgi:hypothetical protein
MLNKITNTQKMPKPSNPKKWIYDTWGVRKWRERERERERACRYKLQKEPYPFEGISQHQSPILYSGLQCTFVEQ